MKFKFLLATPLILGALGGLASTETQAAPVTKRVSIASDGTQGVSSSDAPSISANGRYVAFHSAASNLVLDDTNRTYDIFVRDMQSNLTTRVSVASDGTQSSGSSDNPSINSDGRYVAFGSTASNLSTDDTNGKYDFFVRDTQTNTTRLIALTNDGTLPNGTFANPKISGDGRFLAFDSLASNLVVGDTNGKRDVFVRNLETNTTRRVSAVLDGTQTISDSFEPSISSDGRYVVFVNSDPAVSAYDIYVRDLVTNAISLVSVTNTGTQARSYSVNPAISSDGRYVAFWSASPDLVANDTNDFDDVFVRDLQANTTTRASLANDGSQATNPFGYVGHDSLGVSADGRYVTFTSDFGNLVSGDTNDSKDTFLRDLQANTTTRVNVASDGSQGESNSSNASISADGRYIAFDSGATNLVVGDVNGQNDVFVRDQGVAGYAVTGNASSFGPNSDFSGRLKTNLAGVTVMLQNSQGGTVTTAITDSGGNYRFSEVPVGQYTVSAQLVRSGQATVNLDPPSQTVTIGEADVTAPRFSLYSIFGVAKAPNTSGVIGPRAGIVVSLKNSSGTVLATKTTLADGRFTFGKLAAGTYTLSASKSGLTFSNVTGLVLPGTVTPFAPALKKALTGTRTSSKPTPTASGAKS